MYPSIHGSYRNCNGACKRGSEQCPYYFVDYILETVSKWKQDAHVDSPVLTKYDSEQKKLIIYTTKPGYFIGRNGNLFNQYNEALIYLLRKYKWPREDNISIELIECNDYAD